MVKAARNHFDGSKNLSPIKTHERAVELARRSVDARKLKAERKALLHDDIGETVTAEMDVPDSLYKPMKAYGLKVKKRERIDKVLFYRALLKAIKDGNADQLLKIAEFAGFSDAAERKQKVELSGSVQQKRNIVINFRRATPEDAK
jgi:hypothetical protein